MKTNIAEKPGTVNAEGTAEGGGGAPPLPQLHAAGLPPGVGPQIDLESLGRSTEAEPLLAPTPRSNGTILGYGHARVGRMPPHGGSPSSGPLTGLPLRAPPPVPPVFRRQALEPGHQEPDPFKRIPAVEVEPRVAGEDLGRSLERLERSVAAVRSVPARRRGGAGRHEPVATAAGPAGAGGARVAASLGIPWADSVRGSDRGTYVAGRASGARWEANASVRLRVAGGGDPCAAPATGRKRPLTPLQSVKRYGQQQAASGAKIREGSGPEASRPPEVQPVGVSGPGTKGMSTGTKALSKARGAPPARSFAGMEGKQSDDAGTKPDPESERRLLALRAEIGGLAGRFGARRRRCLVDPTEALRPARGPVEWRREDRAALTKPGGQGRAEPPASKASKESRASVPLGGGSRTVPGTAGKRRASGASLPDEEECALPQKYPARAGVAMRDSAAADASEAAPPGSPGPAQDEEGIAAGRQAPLGQQAYPRQDGADAQARDEAGPGAGGGAAPAGIPSRPPVVAAQGMGGPSGPLLLNAERLLREEAEARGAAQKSVENLREVLGMYGEEVKTDLANGRILERDEKLLGKVERAAMERAGPEGTRHTAALAQAIRDAKAIEAEIRAQKDKADGSSFFGLAQLSLLDEAAGQAAEALERLKRIQARIRILGNMDRGTLRLRALEATHRAERDSYRAKRRALRRERGGVFKTAQFAKVIASTERAFNQERRSTRYLTQAMRMKGGAARDRALARANYHGSLAEAERHRAAVARSHILAPEIAKARGVRDFLKAERRRTAEIYRNERKIADLKLFRDTYEPRFDRVDAELRALARTDEHGQFVNEKGERIKVNGEYVAKDKKDKGRVRELQKEHKRLQQKLVGKLGAARQGRGGRSWGNINNLIARQNVLSTGAAAVPSAFAGTDAGVLMAARNQPGLPQNLRNVLTGEINSLMNKMIAEASARSEAAFRAGLDAGLAMHDEKLTAEQRDAAASTYADALAGAAQAVADIDNAIEEKRNNGVYFEAADWQEYDEDQEKLEEAEARLAALQDVCNSHPACAQAKQDCEAESDENWYCRLVPSSGGGGGGGGGGAGVSGPGASAPVVPGGSEETDGKDEPRKDEPPGETFTSAEPTKPEEEEKKPAPDLKLPDVGSVFRQVATGFVAFAANVQARIREAVGEATGSIEDAAGFLADVVAEAERYAEKVQRDAALAELKLRLVVTFMQEWSLSLQNLEGIIGKAATRADAIAATEKAMAAIERELAGLRFEERELRKKNEPALNRLLESFWRSGLRIEDDPDREIQQQYLNLLTRRGALERRHEAFDRNYRELRENDDHEETAARRKVSGRLHDEVRTLFGLDLGPLLRAGDAAAAADQFKRLRLRLEWSRELSARASTALDGIGWREDERNATLGWLSHWSDRTWHGDGYVEWADALANDVTSSRPPDFDRASTDEIGTFLHSYSAQTRQMARWVGERADENTFRTRLATVYFATAAAAGSLALSGAIAGVAIPAGAGKLLGLGAAALKASAAGAIGAGGFDMGLQAARMIDDANAEFSWDEVLSSVELGAKLGPAMLIPYVPVMAATVGALEGGAEIAKGNVATGVVTAAGSFGLARLLGGRTSGALPSRGVPLQPGHAAAARPAGQVAPVIATGERVPLWRAVENPELVDIVARRAFRRPPGGIEGKVFSVTPEGAAQYARMASRRPWGRPPYTLVETTAPRGIMGGVTHVDRGIPEVVIAGRDLGALSPPQVLDHMPIPWR